MWLDALAHALPVAHGAGADPWIVAGLTAFAVLACIGIGVFLGSRLQAGANAGVAAAFAAGAIIFLLFDLLKETASLGQGLTGRPGLQLLLLVAFSAGLALLALPAQRALGARALAIAWTLGIAAHGAGEAWIVGTEALTIDLTAPTQSASFLLHKLIEGLTIPLVAGVVLGMRHALLLATATAVVAFAAAIAGNAFGPGNAPSVLFALGAGAASYALLSLARRAPLDIRGALAVAGGVLAVYFSGLLHQF